MVVRTQDEQQELWESRRLDPVLSQIGQLVTSALLQTNLCFKPQTTKTHLDRMGDIYEVEREEMWLLVLFFLFSLRQYYFLIF